MTAIQRTKYRWGRWTIGLGALALVIGAVASGTSQAPPAAALAWADESISNGTLREVALLRETRPLRVTTDEASLPVEIMPVNITDPMSTPAPTATRRPIATLMATATPRRTTSRKIVRPSTPQVLPKPSTPLEPLNFSFYAKGTCATREIQNLTMMITAHGGQPPYDYYNFDTVLAKSEKGSVKYSRDAPAGNPVPYKIIIVDSRVNATAKTSFTRRTCRAGTSQILEELRNQRAACEFLTSGSLIEGEDSGFSRNDLRPAKCDRVIGLIAGGDGGDTHLGVFRDSARYWRCDDRWSRNTTHRSVG